MSEDDHYIQFKMAFPKQSRHYIFCFQLGRLQGRSWGSIQGCTTEAFCALFPGHVKGLNLPIAFITLKHHHLHPHRCPRYGQTAPSPSAGQGLPAAVLPSGARRAFLRGKTLMPCQSFEPKAEEQLLYSWLD